MHQPLLTLNQAAERLAISRRTLDRMIARGDLAVVQVTERGTRIDPDELDRYVGERSSLKDAS